MKIGTDQIVVSSRLNNMMPRRLKWPSKRRTSTQARQSTVHWTLSDTKARRKRSKVSLNVESSHLIVSPIPGKGQVPPTGQSLGASGGQVFHTKKAKYSSFQLRLWGYGAPKMSHHRSVRNHYDGESTHASYGAKRIPSYLAIFSPRNLSPPQTRGDTVWAIDRMSKRTPMPLGGWC